MDVLGHVQTQKAMFIHILMILIQKIQNAFQDVVELLINTLMNLVILGKKCVQNLAVF